DWSSDVCSSDLHPDRLAELAERREDVAAAAAELEKPHAAPRERPPQRREEDGEPAPEPPVQAVLLQVDRDVGRIHATHAKSAWRIAAARATSSAGASRSGAWRTLHTG